MTEGHTPELIERVEAAKENDPDLFWEAHYAVNPKPDTIWRDEEREVWTEEYAAYIAAGHRFGELIDAGAFLDAAMTLVPEGWRRWLMDADNGDALCHLEHEETDREIHTRGETWPLAICAASLKARVIP